MKMSNQDWERALEQAKNHGAEPERIWIPVDNFRRILRGGGYTNAEIDKILKKLQVSKSHVCLTK